MPHYPQNLPPENTFSKISYVLERILMEHVDIENSLDSKLQIHSICFIKIRSRKIDIYEKVKLFPNLVDRA